MGIGGSSQGSLCEIRQMASLRPSLGAGILLSTKSGAPMRIIAIAAVLVAAV
jgi:hypothetical protein